jgi:pyruvate-formate lyase-activating enzyme
MELLALRPMPAAGLYMTLTRRCPLSCAHCSTNSTLDSEEHAEDMFLRFAASLSPTDHPEIIALTGGEPLLRPRLVRRIVRQAHSVGARVNLISGMFFARQQRMPAEIARTIGEVDLFTASLDVFHEQEVPRAAVLGVMRALLDQGKDLSFQVTGTDDDDPYLAEVIDEIRITFNDRVPILVARLGPAGRAASWYQIKNRTAAQAIDIVEAPCAMAAWPTVSFDGTIVACCNQSVVDGLPVPHLRLGHVNQDGWPVVRERLLSRTLPRAIRLFGPLYVADRYGSAKTTCDGYCATCYRLSDDPAIEERLERIMASPGMRVVETEVALMQVAGFTRRHGLGRYADLVSLGAPSDTKERAEVMP